VKDGMRLGASSVTSGRAADPDPQHAPRGERRRRRIPDNDPKAGGNAGTCAAPVLPRGAAQGGKFLFLVLSIRSFCVCSFFVCRGRNHDCWGADATGSELRVTNTPVPICSNAADVDPGQSPKNDPMAGRKVGNNVPAPVSKNQLPVFSLLFALGEII
jgi:hypothetical protein